MKLFPYLAWHGAEGDESSAERGWGFWCPGCNGAHQFRTFIGPDAKPRPSYTMVDGKVAEQPGRWPIWTFNGSGDSPTFAPSLLYQTSAGKWVGDKWVDDGPRKVVCHLFMVDGRIQFLSDCPHELANQTVDCPDWPGR